MSAATPPVGADLPPAMSGRTLVLLLAGAIGGALAAGEVMPVLVPSLSQSLLGESPKAFWFVSRSSAFVAFLAVWFSMVLGLLMTNKAARAWPGGPLAYDLHQHLSLLGLVFATFHAFILIGDRYIAYSVAQILTPFASVDYQPLWVGVGQLSLYGLAVVGLSFYARGVISQRGWRVVHYLSFLVFAGAIAHGVMSGSDSAGPAAAALYSAAAGSILFLTALRVGRRLFGAHAG